ncbi:MAG: cbiQ [Anaerocolumna sp.]|nr:cbiQ [Anaerocolumna sp.]
MVMIDKLSYSSKLRYTSPCLKAFFAISTLILTIAAHSFIISFITLIIMVSLTVFNSRNSYKYYFKLYVLPISFLLLSTLTIIINITDEPISPFRIPLFPVYLILKDDAIMYALNLIITSLGAVSCLYFLSLTTPITDILYVLKVIHCPNLIIELLMLIYRFIFILLNSAYSIFISQKCRLGNIDIKTSIKSTSQLFAVLLIQALKRASILYDAMESRCYDGTINVLHETNKATKKEITCVIVFEIILLMIYLTQRRFL